jgi:hypothetical protein
VAKERLLHDEDSTDGKQVREVDARVDEAEGHEFDIARLVLTKSDHTADADESRRNRPEAEALADMHSVGHQSTDHVKLQFVEARI